MRSINFFLRSKWFVLGVGCMASVVFLQLALAPSATAAPVPDQIPDGAMPADIEAYLLDCGGTNNAAAQIGWISLAGRPDSVLIDLDYGTPSINLQYNVAGIVCRQSGMGGLVSTTNGVLTTNPNIPALNGQVLTYNYGSSTGSYSVASRNFTYFHSGGFVSSGEYVFALTEKRINVYSISTRYRCVTNAGDVNFRPPTSATDYDACRSVGAPSFSIWVNVRGRLPTGSIRAECNGSVLTVEVTGSDPDGGAIGVRVDVEPSLGRITELGTRTYNNRPRDGVDHTVSGYITDAQTGARVNLASVTYNCPLPPPDISCGGASPTTADANVPFDLVLGVSNNSPSRDVSYVLRTSGINGQTYSQNVTTPVGTSRTATFNIAGGLPVGIYNFTWTYTDGTYGPGGDKPACSGTITVSAKLLTTVFGGDVQAGAGISYGSGCSVVNRNVRGFLSGVGNNLSGSSVQLGIFAMRHIDGVRSAGQIVPSAPANQLAFANSGLPASNTSIGGSFGVASPCVNDYFGLSGGSTTLPAVDLSTLADGRYIVGNGGSTTSLTTGAGIANARQIVVFVDGDVILNGSTFGYANTSWSNPSELPSLYIIARGNIYVDSAVQRMDGVFIAQQKLNSGNPVDGTGEIFSCSVAGDRDLVRPSASYDIVTSCGQQLVVNGAFIGRRVHLIRSYGSLSSTTPITNTIVATNSATWGSSAEVFRYTSELFLRRNDFLAPNVGGLRYDAITSLAPAL